MDQANREQRSYGRRAEDRRLHRLLEVGRGLVSELDLESLLRGVVEAARELTDARYAALGILDERKRELERFIFTGMPSGSERLIGELPRGRGILGELIRNPEPLRLASVGQHPRSYGFPPAHPPMSTFLGVPVSIRGEAWGNLYLTEKQDGEEFDEADEELLVVLADWAAIAIDNARLYMGVERRRAELERAVRGLEANAEIGRAVGGETDIGRVLELVVKRGRALLDARTLIIFLPEGESLRVAAAAGEGAATLPGRAVPSARSVAGEVFFSGRTERLSDLSSRVRLGLEDLQLEASAGLIAPLAFRGEAYGVLAAFDRLEAGPEFDPDDELLIGSFAASAATAIATAQTVEAEKLHLSIEASERERRRWARELHDETLQELGGLKLMLESADETGDDETVRAAVHRAVDRLDTGIRNLQGLITDLRPAALDEIGVAAALEALVERVAASSTLAVELDTQLDGPRGGRQSRLAPHLESTLYRLVQEALTNTLKHSGASRVKVEVRETGDRILVEVRDDGRGFDARSAGRGFGLVGMRERVALARGSLEIDSAPGRGTAIRAELPAIHLEDDGEPARRASTG
jgi:signal transduction histidine kinase